VPTTTKQTRPKNVLAKYARAGNIGDWLVDVEGPAVTSDDIPVLVDFLNGVRAIIDVICGRCVRVLSVQLLNPPPKQIVLEGHGTVGRLSSLDPQHMNEERRLQRRGSGCFHKPFNIIVYCAS
jgi:hypothetical protein